MDTQLQKADGTSMLLFFVHKTYVCPFIFTIIAYDSPLIILIMA